MSAFEIAGSTLASFLLVILRAEQYREDFKSLERWKRFRTQFISFIDAVDLEKMLFEQMLESFLISVDVADDELHSFMTIPNYEGWSQKDFSHLLQSRLGASYTIYLRTMKTMNNVMCEMKAVLSLEDPGGGIKWASNGERKLDDQLAKIHSNFSILNGVRLLDSLEKNNSRLRELLDPNNKLGSVKVTRKDTAWAKVFGNIRQHASILHTVLQKGWNCTCQCPHPGSLRLQKRTTGEWSSQFNMTFIVPAEAINKVCREVMIRTREIEPEATISHPTFLQSSPAQALYPHEINNGNFDSKPVPQLDEMKPKVSALPLRPSLVKSLSTGFKHKDIHKAGEQARSSTNVSSTTETRTRSIGGARKEKKFVQFGTVRKDPKPQLPPRNLPPAAIATRTKSADTKSTVQINDLCSALWTSEGGNICLGYLQDDQRRYHELHCVDSTHTSQGNNGPVTLEALLMNRGEMRLSRTERYQIASVVASSLLQLETTPWLAGRLEKKNIMFYRRDSDVLLEQPYISHLFRSTKYPQTAPERSKTGLSARFATRDSLSSLGILLLELCFGETIESQHLRKSHLGLDGQPLGGTDYLTARDWAEMVYEEEPALESIIRRCVFCTFEEKADWGNERFTQAVYANVVEPLEQLVNQRLEPV